MHASVLPAVFHHAYGSGYGYHHVHGGGWVAGMVVSALVHALIYGVVFRLMRHLTMPEAILLAGGGLLLVFMWSRSRDRRGW
ncbi:hypothetical protein [Lichenicoccus sp.]|uniref:hypothetical protein n=1 Tax=Lichenicoccus sp. TaxID=2781899 RepID=UPI003D134BFB